MLNYGEGEQNRVGKINYRGFYKDLKDIREGLFIRTRNRIERVRKIAAI